jgi:hypothetical protein
MAQFPYLYFQTASDDAVAIPVSELDGIDIAATAMTITATHNFVQYKAVLTVTAGQEELALKELIRVINQGPHHDGLIVVADDENSTYFHPGVTACGALTVDITQAS